MGKLLHFSELRGGLGEWETRRCGLLASDNDGRCWTNISNSQLPGSTVQETKAGSARGKWGTFSIFVVQGRPWSLTYEEWKAGIEPP